jgi:hypothetical protein
MPERIEFGFVENEGRADRERRDDAVGGTGDRSGIIVRSHQGPNVRDR